MRHLITLDILFEPVDVATTVKRGIIRLPSLEKRTICGIACVVSSLIPAVDAFECDNLQVFHAELSSVVSPPGPEDVENLLISIHGSFPILKQLFLDAPDNSWPSYNFSDSL
ncbi:hypothetical protein BD410DRAFT_783346 [Rickenella mellea]|uniref:Uncharacterized protein n=1 Tax=Rickenella mellea TaxID=50990 RepID=A0A4Y7QHL7_9AGAM|nr:hypothetical protein BD410DRAFT_783346 [Rickenella mellea]